MRLISFTVGAVQDSWCRLGMMVTEHGYYKTYSESMELFKKETLHLGRAN